MSYRGLIPTAEPFFFPGGRTGCLLVHGFTGTPKEMRWMGDYLAKQGHSVLGVRLAAHATQPEDMIRSRWHDWLASVEDGWHLLSGCTDQIFVIGLSMGGLLALTLADRLADRLAIAGLVILSTPHHLPADPRLPFVKLLSMFQRFIPKGEASYYDPEAFRDHTSYSVDPTRAYAEVRELVNQMQAVLPKIKVPALLIYSKNDGVVTAEEKHMELIFNALGSQDKQMMWLENSSHVITRDAQRQKVFTAAAEFIAQRNALKV